MSITRRIVLTQEMRARSPYLAVPFDVAPGSDALEVELSFVHASARVDIGCEGPAGWRGWSGSARRRFVIGSRAATWGYLPGELEAGVWHVVLGLHVLPAEGLPVEIEISIPGGSVDATPRPPAVTREVAGHSRRGFPAPPGRTWYAGDFHAHSLHSDGSQSLEQLAARAVAEGLDFLAITDHNTVSHHPLLSGIAARYGITLLPGQEVTTARGHANAFGAIPWVDFRRHPDHWVDEVEAAGGLLSINHPVSGDCSWQWPLRRHPSHAELMHSSWLADPPSSSIWSWVNAWGTPRALGGTDFHNPESGLRPGMVTTWVAAEENSAEAILAAALDGHTALTMGIDAPALIRLGDEIEVIGAEGMRLGMPDGSARVITAERTTVAAPAGDRPYRLEDADRRTRAITV